DLHFLQSQVIQRAFKFLIYSLILFSGLTTKSTAQPLGLLPGSVKWFQLSHDSVQVIYPAGKDSLARHLASLMVHQARNHALRKDGKFKRIPVLLQPRTNISNGYVGIAPSVSEFYLQPSQSVF